MNSGYITNPSSLFSEVANGHLPAKHIIPVFAGAIAKVTFEFTAELRGTFVSNMDGCLTDARMDLTFSGYGNRDDQVSLTIFLS